MAENSHISWTDNTFNPWMGCTKVSPACQNCYAERDMDHRYHKVAWGPQGTRVKTSAANWKKPLRWNHEAEAGICHLCHGQGILVSRAKRLKDGEVTTERVETPCSTCDGGGLMTPYRLFVFCASLADVFEEWGGPIHDACGDIICRPYLERENTPEFWCSSDPESLKSDPQGWRPITLHDLRRELFKCIDATPQLDWLLLTKRPENVERMWPQVGFADAGVPGTLGRRLCLENVILGTSIENQEWTDKRLPHLHAAKRNGLVRRTFVSAEPLVGPVMLHGDSERKGYRHLGGDGIDWVITGGESGLNARPCNPDWFRSLRDQAEAAGVPFHFKQWGEFDVHEQRVGVNVAGRLLDGRTHDERPRVASVGIL